MLGRVVLYSDAIYSLKRPDSSRPQAARSRVASAERSGCRLSLQGCARGAECQPALPVREAEWMRAQPAAVTPDTLIPPDLRKQLDPASIPDAFVGENVKLGGEARMTATSVTEQQGMWKTLLVWGALVLGVAVLAWMAIRIWREAQSPKV